MNIPQRSLIVSAGAAALLAAAAGRAQAQIPDHLECYKIKDPVKLQAFVDLDSPQFGVAPNCTVGKAVFFCGPTAKTVLSAVDEKTRTPIVPLPFSAPPAAEDRVCYKLKCPAPALVPDQTVTDQFGTRTLGKFKRSLLCTPAVKGAAFCGDATLGAGEQCEGSNLDGASCTSLGFSGGGTLACGPGCRFETSGCACAAPGGGSFPATGQTTCWNSSGTVIPCAGTGHDGDVQAGAPLSFTDNGDGTITDTNTGLMWAKKSDDGSIHDKDNSHNWGAAFSVHVAGLNAANFAGHNDWRLPNVKELQSIVNYENVSPAVSPAFNTGCAPGCTVTTCSCTQAYFYWSSTSFAGSPDGAWSVSFFYGDVNGNFKSDSLFVRAVRGGS